MQGNLKKKVRLESDCSVILTYIEVVSKLQSEGQLQQQRKGHYIKKNDSRWSFLCLSAIKE
jgi:hypothetical protein